MLTGQGHLGGVNFSKQTGTDHNILSELDPQNFLFTLHGLDQLDAESGSKNRPYNSSMRFVIECGRTGSGSALYPVLQTKLTALALEFI